MRYNKSKLLRGFLILLIAINVSANLVDKTTLEKLSSNNQWLKLGHYKNNKSQIDSPSFFLAQEGKNNPYKELKSTIEDLIDPATFDDNSTYCKFPARREWIKKQLPDLPIKTQSCLALTKELSQLKDITKIVLSFPTTNNSSPASMFGHTLLRLDDNSDDSLNSFAVNYAAWTNESNGFIYAWMGLTGGYQGRYSIVPYYEKIQEYNAIENRDIWEFELDLTQEEIDFAILHIMEIKNHWSYYYYFNKNCSYEILWILDVAKNNLNLTDQFNYKTLPIDTIKSIDEKKLIKDSIYRASKEKIIHKYFDSIKNKQLALDFVKEFEIEMIKNEEPKEQQKILDYALEMLLYKKSKNQLDKKEYLKKYLTLLKLRSKYSFKNNIVLSRPISPIKTHDSNKIWLGYDSKNQTKTIGIKPSFHGEDDFNDGFTDGAYIDFFVLEANIDKSNKTRLENLSFFDIKSFAKRDKLFTPLSWSVDLGYERFKDEELYAKLKTNVGVTYGSENFLSSFLLPLNIYSKDKKLESGVGLGGYFEYNLNNYKFAYNISKVWYESHIFIDQNAFLLYKISKKFNIKLAYENRLETQKSKLEFGYYF